MGQIYCKRHRIADMDSCSECDEEIRPVNTQVRLYFTITPLDCDDAHEYTREENLEWAKADILEILGIGRKGRTGFPRGITLVDWEYELES